MQAIRDRMFSDPAGYSVNELYREMSEGQVSFSGEVAGPYTLNVSSTDACANNAWASAADALAAADGLNPASYARKVYVLPPSPCPAAGMADLGVTPSRAWVFTCDVAHVYAHELGHNLGMHHAATETSEYGDNTDIMGMQGGLMPVNAPHKSQMGWLRGASIAAIAEDGTYEIAPLALPRADAAVPQALQVAKPDSMESYFVSYRHGTGFEANACCQYLDRVNLHRWAGGSARTYLLATLTEGQSYVDSDNGFTVTHVSRSSTSAVVRVQRGVSCGTAAPTLRLTPRDQTGSPGVHAVYDLTLTNEDGPACSPSTSVLSRTVPPGWSSSLSAGSLLLPPGGVGSATLSVTVPPNAPSGAYGLTASASNAMKPHHAASANGSFTVARACTGTPQTAFDVSSQSGTAGTTLKYVLTIVNRDTAGCGNTTFAAQATVPSGWQSTSSIGYRRRDARAGRDRRRHLLGRLAAGYDGGRVPRVRGGDRGGARAPRLRSHWLHRHRGGYGRPLGADRSDGHAEEDSGHAVVAALDRQRGRGGISDSA